MYVPTAAFVTNLSAHFKWGRESSLVWVTSLDKAEPVKALLSQSGIATGKRYGKERQMEMALQP